MSFFKVLIFRNTRNGAREFEKEFKSSDFESAFEFLIKSAIENDKISKTDFIYEFWENGKKRSNPQLIQELLLKFVPVSEKKRKTKKTKYLRSIPLSDGSKTVKIKNR